jgi:hypothetical protein
MNPLIPLTLLFAGFPFFSKGASTKAWVQKTLTNVDGAVFLIKLFLAFAAVVISIILGIWLILLHRKKKRQKMIQNVIALLQRLRADISLLHNESNMEPILKQELTMSKKQAISLLRRYFMKKSLLKNRLNAYKRDHLSKSLDIIDDNRVNHQNQMLLIDQWVKNLQNQQF